MWRERVPSDSVFRWRASELNRKQRRIAARARNRALPAVGSGSPLFNQATAFHRAGRLAEAEELYRQTLKAQPNHFDSLHMLGVIYSHMGRHPEAIRQIDVALRVNHNVASAHCNRALALQKLKRFEEALVAFNRAI